MLGQSEAGMTEFYAREAQLEKKLTGVVNGDREADR